MAPKTDIELLTAGTPNGHKGMTHHHRDYAPALMQAFTNQWISSSLIISITLEELGVQYNARKIEFSKNEQKEPWFLEINPNGRIPAIVDKTSGKPKRVFEGASIQLYLCEKYDKDHKISFPYDSDEYWESVEWMVWMQSGIGPMQGQANHFYRYAPEKIPYAINRYQTETKRLYTVLNDRLAAQRTLYSLPPSSPAHLIGNKYSLADICIFSWVEWGEWAGVHPDEFDEIKLWREAIEKRPAVVKGTNVPDEFKMKEIMRNKEKSEEYAKKSSGWIMKGMKEDEERQQKI